MIKTLYISYDGMTDNLGQSQVIPYLKGLSEKGIDITILSFEKKDMYREKSAKISSLLKKANIKWYPLRYTKRPPVISTIKDIIMLINTGKRLYKEHKFTIIHCRSYISAIAGLYLKKRYNVKFIFDMRGFWANERVDGDIWNIKTPVYRWIFNYFKSLEIKFLSTADYIISLTHSGKEVIKHWNIPDVSQSNIEVIPCCADFNHFCKSENQSKKTQQYKKELGIVDDNFVLSYLGSLGTWYMLDEMLDFFKVLLEQRPNALFLFITGDNPDFIYNSAMNKNIDKSKIIIASSSREDVPAYIDISDMAIFFIKPFFSKKASSPTKMAEIMGMGIPIICNNNVGDVESIMQESNSGIIIKEFSNEAYNKAILEIDNVLKKDKEEIREYSIKTFSLEEGVAKYLKIYNNLNECSK